MVLSMNSTLKKIGSAVGKSSAVAASGDELKECNNLEQRTAVGKRFARRAKRWAELQQRRQSSRQAHSNVYSPAFTPVSVSSDSFSTTSSPAFNRRQASSISSNGDNVPGQYIRNANTTYDQTRYYNINSCAKLIENNSSNELINVELAAMGVGMIPFLDTTAEVNNLQEHICCERHDVSSSDDTTDIIAFSALSRKASQSELLDQLSKQETRFCTFSSKVSENGASSQQYFIMNAGSKQEAFVSVYQLPAELHVYPNAGASTKHTAIVRLDTSSSLSSTSSCRSCSSRARDECSSSSSDEDAFSWIASDLANVSIQCGDCSSCRSIGADLGNSRSNEIIKSSLGDASSLVSLKTAMTDLNYVDEGWFYSSISSM
ncbi:unnamed protein product [Anisakis simplex]|uniref:SH2 domain-containing protein n=1 Tax=Anisakis simplex TaxID=6269 RepID=A0A0M3K4H5_ANISI|nr:unnamed protein product [Anisakis simplex]